MNIAADYLFYSLDKVLAREIASYPYQTAYESIFLTLGKLPGVKVWTRNSYRLGNFVFGLSDLDLTISLDQTVGPRELTWINEVLKHHKRIYPFLGEANFLKEDVLPIFSPSLNHYERLRDPVLNGLIGASEANLRQHKVSFLLRMLSADRVKLKHYPQLRQKKWQRHFHDLDLPQPHLVKFEDVVREIAGLMEIDLPILKEALAPLESRVLTDQMIFHGSMPKLWKFLFPNKHIWFARGDEEKIETYAGSIYGDICLRQIEWEMWGLMTQFPYLDPNTLGGHLDRQVQVAEKLSTGGSLRSQADTLMGLVSDFRARTHSK